MIYRIEIAGRPSKTVLSRSALLAPIRTEASGTITDIRKLYRSGVSDSVLDTYAKYIGNCETKF